MKETFIPKSDHIAEVSYDGDDRTMTITFQDGRSYEYAGVSQDVYLQMQRAPSVGSFFHRHVRGVYPDTEI